MTRLNVSFAGYDGTALRGWLYVPVGASGLPAIVMAHGFAATKEMGLAAYAQTFAQAAMVVLVYDHRALGQSDGVPRQLIDAFVQTRDMGCAVDFLAGRPEVDAGRIGLWGTSYSGGEALIQGAINPVVRAVAAIVPYVGWPEKLQAGGTEDYAALIERVRTATIDPAAIVGPRAVVPQPGAVSEGLMPDPPTTDWMLTESRHSEGRWLNQVLMPARPGDLPFNPAVAMPHVHVPTLMIAGSVDRVTPEAGIRAAAALAGDTVELLVLEGHHCSFYRGEPQRDAAAAARDLFLRAL